MDPTVQTTPIIYGGFRKRVLAALVDLGFGIFVVPTIVSIYYYFAEGQTLGYKVVGLKILRSDEISKPGFWRLFARWIVKGAGGVVIVGVVWFIFNLLFWILRTMANAQEPINSVNGTELIIDHTREAVDPMPPTNYMSGAKSITVDYNGTAGQETSTMRSLVNRFFGLLSLLSMFWMGIMSLSVIWNRKKRGRHDQIVDTTVLQVSQTQTVRAIVGVVLFVGGIIVNVLVRLAGSQ